MRDEVVLEFDCEGQQLSLPVRAYPYGHTYRIEVKINTTNVIFESDEEGKYRALGTGKKIEISLIKAIIYELEDLN